MALGVYGLLSLSSFVILAVAEAAWTARPAATSDARLLTNFGLGVIGITLTALLPIGVVSVAAYTADHGLGLMGVVDVPLIVAFAAVVAWRTLIQYGAHRLSHAVPWLWRVHRVHHNDHQVDVTTSLRNHPIEQLVVLAAALPGTLVLGAPLAIVLLVELMLFVGNAFSHANMRLPPALSGRLSSIIVTPAVHLVHHSSQRQEHDANFGVLLTLWDWVFGTYRLPAGAVSLGLADEPERDVQALGVQLAKPFRRAH